MIALSFRVSRAAAFCLASCAFACGAPADKGASSPSSPSAGKADGDSDVKETVIVEKLPDGSTKTTKIRTTKTTVPAPPPPARPADPWPADPWIRYNVERVNAYRAAKNIAPLLYDAKISSFALAGSNQLAKDHAAHAHFAANVKGAPGFGSRAAENQGDPAGVPPLENAKSEPQQIDLMLKLMMDEGPGGGHYDNIMNASYRRIGIGIAYVGGRMYLTNDFSD